MAHGACVLPPWPNLSLITSTLLTEVNFDRLIIDLLHQKSMQLAQSNLSSIIIVILSVYIFEANHTPSVSLNNKPSLCMWSGVKLDLPLHVLYTVYLCIASSPPKEKPGTQLFVHA